MDWKNTIISNTSTIKDAIKTIDESRMMVAFIVDERQKLLGMVTDRDLRRGLLKRYPLDTPVIEIMNSNPTTSSTNIEQQEMRNLLIKTGFRHLPVLDQEGRLVNVVFLDDISNKPQQESWVVLMVGGLGSRLGSLTEDCPKPMLKIGNKPLLETILENFIEYGFLNFFLSVNYKSEIIEDYFGDGKKWDINIQYLREKQSLGTAGALSLIPEQPDKPLIVMNGDLLTKVNFHQLLEFHTQHGAKATMGVREYDLQVPYGVVDLDLSKYSINKIIEKPVHRFFVNAGIYVLEPELLPMIPENQIFDMPSLFEQAIEKEYTTSAFPIREYWLDIGQKDDLIRANGEFNDVFTTYTPKK